MNKVSDARALIETLAPLFRAEPEVALARLHQEVEKASKTNSREAKLLLLDELAWQVTSRFEAEEALPAIQQFLEQAEMSGISEWIGRANNTYGVYLLNAGDNLTAIDRLSRALFAFESIGDRERTASVLANIGEMLVDMEDIERSGPYLEESECFGQVEGRPELRINRTYVLYEQGKTGEVWRRVVGIWKEGREEQGWPMRAYAHELAGWIRQRSGETVAAIRHLEKAIHLFSLLRDPYRMAKIRLALAEILLREAKMEQAAEEYRLAAEISGALGYQHLEIKALRKLLPVTSGPVEGLAVQQRLVTALQQMDKQNRAIRRNFVHIRIRAEEARQERLRLEYDLERDALTGLLSSRHFKEKLHVQASCCEHFALLFLDVDKLKELNDKMGHAAGDMLLRSFANDVADALPKGGMAFRKSGDEFLVLLPHAGRTEVESYLQDLFARLAIARRIGGEWLALSCSAGIALWPFDSKYEEQLEWMADQAMYRAKAAGRNHWAWHVQSSQG